MGGEADVCVDCRAYRRRNGIPDSDHRAFNVAYAAAQRLKEKETGNGATTKRLVFPTLKAPSEGELRQRSNLNNINGEAGVYAMFYSRAYDHVLLGSNHVSHTLAAPMGNGGLQSGWERPRYVGLWRALVHTQMKLICVR